MHTANEPSRLALAAQSSLPNMVTSGYGQNTKGFRTLVHKQTIDTCWKEPTYCTVLYHWLLISMFICAKRGRARTVQYECFLNHYFYALTLVPELLHQCPTFFQLQNQSITFPEIWLWINHFKNVVASKMSVSKQSVRVNTGSAFTLWSQRTLGAEGVIRAEKSCWDYLFILKLKLRFASS